VFYDLRPAKQVERRMLIDALQRLSMSGFNLHSYQYTGFGSIFFVDFILLHKFLGISRLLSVEHDPRIAKRIRFNQPYKQIAIELRPVGDVIPTLSADLRHLLWLDYDDIISRSHIGDLVQVGTNLSVGSIVLVTVDVEHPRGDTPSEWREHFIAEAEEFLGPSFQPKDFEASKLPALNAAILQRALKRGLAGRQAEFIPLFNFVYADGHQMLTAGGMIGTETERRQIFASTLSDTCYYRSDFALPPYRILIPRVTRKERLYLDSAMPCSKRWRPKEFELKADDVRAYREIYRFFPAYAELLL
jgi:hypothetical protein